MSDPHPLGPFFGSLPPDVLREVLLPKLDHLSRGFFALAAGACWRAVKDAGLFSVVDTGSLCELAAVGGHTALLRYARQHGCPWDTRTCEGAARGGHLGCLWFASKLGCPWDERTCQVAAGNGQLRCLRHAQETGCPWDGTTCAAAAEGGYLDCLRYAHEHGCPWDGPCASAAREGIWSACDMHMRMDARGTGPPARQQPGRASGVPSLCT